MTYSRIFTRGLIAAALAGAATLPTLAGAQAQPGYDRFPRLRAPRPSRAMTASGAW